MNHVIRLTANGVLLAVLPVLVAITMAGDKPSRRFISPDHRFEAYAAPTSPELGETKLFIRKLGSSLPGTFLISNMRWIDAKWSPDSQYLAVIDHSDGHTSDVLVFGVKSGEGEGISVTLYYQSPNPGTYDVRWDVIGWDLREHSILLQKESRDAREDRPGYIASAKRTTVKARIGTTPIPWPKR